MTWQDIPGWFDFGEIYDRSAMRCKDGEILIEVGSWLGKSVNYLASKCKSLGKRPMIVAVDTFCHPAPEYRDDLARHGGSVVGEFLRNLEACGNSDIVRTFVMTSVAAASTFKKGTARMVFLDAGHDYQSVYWDIRAWHDVVMPEGIFAGHDYCAPGVNRAVTELLPAAVDVPPLSWLDSSFDS